MARILLVDDDPMIMKLYQLILKHNEFELQIAVSGNEMLSAINEQKPDVILLDVVLPDHSGLDLCNRVKSDPDFSSTKIILISGEEIKPEQIAAGIELGADDYLVKPFHPKELLARVRNVLKLKNIEEELRDKNAELKNLSSYLQRIREEERKSVAYEIQEDLGQLTAALKMEIDWLGMNLTDIPDEFKERMTHASDITKLIINSSRRIASSLRPSMIDELSLPTSLEWQCRRFSSLHSISCQFMHEQVGDDTELPSEIKTALFRICQEALMNIAQHANATAVSVLSKQIGKNMKVVISDNGIGFANDQSEKPYGLIGMRERAHSFNGELTIHSAPGKGTTISVTIPVP